MPLSDFRKLYLCFLQHFAIQRSITSALFFLVFTWSSQTASAQTHVHDVYTDTETAGGVTFGWSEDVGTNLQSDDNVDNTSFIDQES